MIKKFNPHCRLRAALLYPSLHGHLRTGPQNLSHTPLCCFPIALSIALPIYHLVNPDIVDFKVNIWHKLNPPHVSPAFAFGHLQVELQVCGSPADCLQGLS